MAKLCKNLLQDFRPVQISKLIKICNVLFSERFFLHLKQKKRMMNGYMKLIQREDSFFSGKDQFKCCIK